MSDIRWRRMMEMRWETSEEQTKLSLMNTVKKAIPLIKLGLFPQILDFTSNLSADLGFLHFNVQL